MAHSVKSFQSLVVRPTVWRSVVKQNMTAGSTHLTGGRERSKEVPSSLKTQK